MSNETQEFGWWIEILTEQPMCIYYFGAFDNYWEAEWFKSGYIQDLEEEKSRIVNIDIKRGQPEKLTIYIGWEKTNEDHINKFVRYPTFSYS